MKKSEVLELLNDPQASILYLQDVITGRGEVKGYTYTRVYEDTTWSIYRVSESHFEVFKRRYSPPHPMYTKDVTWDLKEIYPSSKRFGVDAWTCRSLSAAAKKAGLVYEDGGFRVSKDWNF